MQPTRNYLQLLRTSVGDVRSSAEIDERAATVERDGFALGDLVQHVPLEVRVGEQLGRKLARDLQSLERLPGLHNFLDIPCELVEVRLRDREPVLQEHLVEEAALAQRRSVRQSDLVLELLLQRLDEKIIK
jgi:hypothetical protein